MPDAPEQTVSIPPPTPSNQGPAISGVPQPVKPGAWAPLKVPLFRNLWIATVISNIGTWAQEFGGPWLMRLLTPDKFWVGFVSFASNLPLCFLSTPAGVLADILDRRRFLIFTQIWMLVASGLLGVLTLCGVLSVSAQVASITLLLGFTALLAIGNALSGPPFQAIVPELVPPGQMPLAVSLNSVALNVARAVGPAVGMLIAAIAAGKGSAGEIRGLGAAFLFNALSFVGVAWVVFRWNRPKSEHAVKAEDFFGAMKTGFVYTRHSRALQFILLRVFLFILCAVAMWSQLATIAKDQMGLSSPGYALLMVCLGAGAVIGVILMPRLQKALDIDRMVLTCTAAFAIGILLLSFVHGSQGATFGRRALTLLAACPVMLFIGFNWVIVPTNFNIATQRSVPNWVKGRALSMYLTTLFGTWAIGSVFWGWIAEQTQSTAIPLAVAGCALLAGLLLARRFPLTLAKGIDFAPAKRPAPCPENLDDLARGGPVRIVMEYHISPERREQFEPLAAALRRCRLQNGAVLCDLQEAGLTPAGHHLFRETFAFRSWTGRLRHHERTTQADVAIEGQVFALHEGQAPPVTLHESYIPIPGVNGEPIPLDQHFAEWCDLVIGKMQREIVRATSRQERLRHRASKQSL